MVRRECECSSVWNWNAPKCLSAICPRRAKITRKMTINQLNWKSTFGKNNQLKKNIKKITYRKQQRVRDRNRKAVKICFGPARSLCMTRPLCPKQADHPPLACSEDLAPGWDRTARGMSRDPLGVTWWGFLTHIYTGGCREQHGHVHSWNICTAPQNGAANEGCKS